MQGNIVSRSSSELKTVRMSRVVLDAVQGRKKDKVLLLIAKHGITDPVLLHFTCGNGWKDVAEEIIMCSDTDPDQAIYGATPLHFACTSGNLELVQYLVFLGCNVFKYTEDGLNVLHCAIMGGLDIVKYFISTDYNFESLYSPEAMLFAYYNWSNELIKYLLVDKSLDMVLDHETGDTLLHYACRDGRLDRVQFLIEKCCCNPNVINSNHDTVLHTFCSFVTISGEIAVEIIDYLLHNEFCEPSKLNAQKNSILDCAVMAKKSELVKHLLDVNIHFSASTKTICTFLAYTNSYWDDCMIKFLIKELGCPIVTNKTTDDTVLHDACCNMDLRKLKFLVEECDCDPDAFTGQEKNSLLHAFCSSNTHPSREILAYLKLKCRSYMFMHKAINHFGYTPLEWAIFNSNPFVVPITRCLIEEHGSADKLLTERILALAYSYWSDDLIKYLLVEMKCSPIINGDQIFQKLSKDREFCRLDFLLGINFFCSHSTDVLLDLVSNGFSSVTVSHNKAAFSMKFDCENPLYQAIDFSFSKKHMHLSVCLFKTLINKTNYIHMHYSEVLELVVFYWNKAVIKYLLVESKLDTIECTDPEMRSLDNTAIVTAACKELTRVKFLVESCKYDPNAVNSEGETLVHVAANTGTFDVLQYLFIECKCHPNLNGQDAGTMAMKTAIAQKERGMVIIKHLVEKCKVESDSIIMSCTYTNWCNDVIQYLIDTAGFDLTVNPTTGFTIFHLACISGEINELKFVADRLCCGHIKLAADSLPSLFQIACHNFKNHHIRSDMEYGSSVMQYNYDILQYCISSNSYLTVDKEAILAVVSYCTNHKTINAGMGVAQYLIERCGSSITSVDLASMLLKAYSIWHEEMILYILKTKCNSIINMQTGDTILHRVCVWKAYYHSSYDTRQSNLKFLIENCKCDVTATNWYQQTILHVLILTCCVFDTSHMNIISFIMGYIPKEKHQSMICMRDTRGNTILHLICSSNKANTDTKIRYLSYFFQFIQHDFNIMDNQGSTVLHLLCDLYFHINPSSGSDILSYIHNLIKHNKCYHSVPDTNMNTILHRLVSHPQCIDHQSDQLRSLIRYLIYDCHMDITSKNTKGETVFKQICRQTTLNADLIEELITTDKADLLSLCSVKAACDFKLNPLLASFLTRLIIEGKGDLCTLKDSDSNTILHLLVLNNVVYSSEFLSLIHHLIYNCQCDVTSQNKYGETVLHMACNNFSWDVSLIERIMSTGKADMLTSNKSGKSPLMILGDRCHALNNDRAFKHVNQLISRFGEVQVAHPIHSYVNVILLGNPGAGKSTLAKVIEDRKKHTNITAQYRKVKGVELHTAGIIPKVLNDKDIGRVILHDLAGQAEYYSSHTAVLENLLQGSAAVFVLVVSLADEGYIKSLNLWLNVIKNVSHNALHQCQLIIVASHIDHSIVNDLDLLTHSIGDLCSSNATILKYHGVFSLDCRKLGGTPLASFISALSAGCKLISDANINEEMSLYCHMVYDFFLRDGKPVYTLETLTQLAKEVNGLFLPEDTSHVDSIISSLSSTGLIVFLRNPSILLNSWIVADKSILLKDLDGILFAPQDFKEHVNISSNIGVVKLSDLQSLFPNYDPELLLQFLQYMELCSIISNDFIEANTSTPLTNTSEQYIFVPALIKSIDKPAEISQSAFKFGWKLCCFDNSFFLSRFLHLVQLHLTCKCSVHKSATSSKFERFCKIWTRGLYWKDTKGVQTLVELADSNQSLIVLTSCEEGAEAEMLNLIHDVVNEILLCKQQAMPKVSTQEFIINSSSLHLPQCSTSLNSSSVPLYSVELLARCAINNDRFVLDTSGEKQLAITKLIAVPDVCQEQIFKAVFANRDPKDLANGASQITSQHQCPAHLIKSQGHTNPPNTEDSVDSNSFINEEDSTDSLNNDKIIRVLKSYTSDLVCLISDPHKLANSLWSVNLLTFEEKAEIQTMSHGIITKSISLLNAFTLCLLSCNRERTRKFEMIMKFCNVLKNQDDPPLSRIADDIMKHISP